MDFNLRPAFSLDSPNGVNDKITGKELVNSVIFCMERELRTNYLVRQPLFYFRRQRTKRTFWRVHSTAQTFG